MSTEAPAPLPWPEATDRIILDEVDSTMAEASRRAASLDRPTWIMAHRQTGARGRRGRAWAMPKGNFAATYVFRPDGNAATAALRSFSAANAVFEAVAMFIDRDRLSVKWPNDVLLDGGKLCGILLESMGTATSVDWLSVGVGVNLKTSPHNVTNTDFPPVSLMEAGGTPVDPKTFLTVLATNMATEEALFATLGFAPIREKWLKSAARLGEVITARTGTSEITGTFDTLDEAGQLVLETPHGRETIPAADVYF